MTILVVLVSELSNLGLVKGVLQLPGVKYSEGCGLVVVRSELGPKILCSDATFV